jgi:oligo-1,6-glucosidase
MRLIIDLVVNHTSDEHHWFMESRSSKGNPYRDYYIWRDGRPNPDDPSHPLPPNNYPSYFSGSAWQYDPATQQFYLHLFAIKQPDLNWDNPKVREDVFSLMRFWLDKGVDGFRMDVIPLISKQPGLPDLTPEQLKDPSRLWANGPRRDEYLQQMNREALSKYDVMTVGEAIGITLEEETKIINSQRRELNMVFNFDAVRVNRGDGYTTRQWTLPYQGDELGMTNYPFTRYEQFDDIEVKNAYKEKVQTGKMPESQFVAEAHRFGRDNSRTPMQWSAAPNAGFTTATAKPWLAVNPNYTSINAAEEVANPNSVYSYALRAIALHHAHTAFVYGDYKDLDPTNTQVFAYTRTLDGSSSQRFLIVLNFGEKPVEYKLPDGMKAGKLLLGNLRGATEAGSPTLHLEGWEARVYAY